MFSLTYGIQTRKKKNHEERRLPVSEYRENRWISSGDIHEWVMAGLEHCMFKVPGMHA